MPIRRIKDGFTVEQFVEARDAYVELLEANPGTLNDREIQPYFDFVSGTTDLDRTYVGITSFVDFSTFQEIGEAVSGDVAKEFFNTFDFISFQVLQPLNDGEVIILRSFAPLGSDQVWKIAVRDTSNYENFDQTDYENRRDAYLSVLADQDGYVQKNSGSLSQILMFRRVRPSMRTQLPYKTLIVTRTSSTHSTATGFLDFYPPNVFGMISNVLS